MPIVLIDGEVHRDSVEIVDRLHALMLQDGLAPAPRCVRIWIPVLLGAWMSPQNIVSCTIVTYVLSCLPSGAAEALTRTSGGISSASAL